MLKFRTMSGIEWIGGYKRVYAKDYLWLLEVRERYLSASK
jgi:hypothetical protein